MSSRAASSRFQALDLLRGFFIVIIIVDHLSRWPSAFGLISGKGLLWVTAAEGFVIISGLLVGYIRGAKAKTEAMKSITLKLWRRALTLYIWAIIGSIAYTAALWYIPLAGGAPGLPIDKGDWGRLLFESVTLHYTFIWVYFLKLYAIFLAASPLALWLLRQGKAWLVGTLSFAALALGWLVGSEALQWQFVFFIPMIAGYYMPRIQSWWQSLEAKQRRGLAAGIVGVTVLTVVASVISTYLPQVSSTLDRANASLFAKDSMGLLRALTAFVWFAGYLIVFIYFEKYISAWFGWLLRPIGTHSLTAYILHGVAIVIISFLFASGGNIIANTLLGALAIMIVWSLLKIPRLNRVVPR